MNTNVLAVLKYTNEYQIFLPMPKHRNDGTKNHLQLRVAQAFSLVGMTGSLKEKWMRNLHFRTRAAKLLQTKQYVSGESWVCRSMQKQNHP